MWRREAGAQELEAFVCEEATGDRRPAAGAAAEVLLVSVINGDLSKMGQFEGPRGHRWRQRPPPDQIGRRTFVAYDISY